MNARIDLSTGKPMPKYGRPAMPISGRWCECQHNHSIAFGRTTNFCPSCPCEHFTKASG